MPSIPIEVKLRSEGDSIILTITACTKVPTGKWPEWAVTGIERGSNLLKQFAIPEKSFIRQLDRLELQPDNLTGLTLRFWRAANKEDSSKPFWNVDLLEDEAEHPTPTIPVPPRGVQTARSPIQGPYREANTETGGPPHDEPEPSTLQNPKLDAMLALHERCFQHAVGLAEYAKGKGIVPDMAGVSALTAQLWIAATQRGIA